MRISWDFYIGLYDMYIYNYIILYIYIYMIIYVYMINIYIYIHILSDLRRLLQVFHPDLGCETWKCSFFLQAVEAAMMFLGHRESNPKVIER